MSNTFRRHYKGRTTSRRSGNNKRKKDFTCLEERKQRAAAAKWLALVSLVFCLCQFWQEWKLYSLLSPSQQSESPQPTTRSPKDVFKLKWLLHFIAALALLTSGSLVIAQQDLYPQVAYVSNSSISKGTAIAAMAVGGTSAFLSLYVRAFFGPITHYYETLLVFGLFVAVMAVIFFGFAIENDHWTWEGDKLVTKDYWEDCDSYNEGTCETMDQWNEKKC